MCVSVLPLLWILPRRDHPFPGGEKRLPLTLCCMETPPRRGARRGTAPRGSPPVTAAPLPRHSPPQPVGTPSAKATPVPGKEGTPPQSPLSHVPDYITTPLTPLQRHQTPEPPAPPHTHPPGQGAFSCVTRAPPRRHGPPPEGASRLSDITAPLGGNPLAPVTSRAPSFTNLRS